MKLAKEGVNCGVFLLLSSIGISMQEIPNRLAENIRTIICLEMGDRFAYADALRVVHFDVMPEPNVKGRGLAKVEDNFLEFQTALAVEAEDDFSRAELIREKALHALSDEVPHGIAVAVDAMKKRKGKRFYDIDATIICEKDSHKGIIIGKGGQMLKKIGTNARYEIERMLDAKCNLKLFVRVKKDWRDSDYLVSNFGYREEDA